MAYVSISVEGGIFPSDLLDRIAAGDGGLPGQRASDFRVDGNRRLTDEIQSAFSDARSYWDAFQRRLERSQESRTTLTREYWVRELLELLGFEKLVVQRASAEAGNERYFISHRAGDAPDAPPVHIVALGLSDYYIDSLSVEEVEGVIDQAWNQRAQIRTQQEEMLQQIAGELESLKKEIKLVTFR